MRIICLLFFFMIVSVAVGNVFSFDMEKTAVVEIVSLTEVGEPFDQTIKNRDRRNTKRVELLRHYSNKDYGGGFHATETGFRGDTIPYGEYTLRLVNPGFKVYQQVLKIYQPRVSIRAVLNISIDNDSVPTVKGSIKPIPSPSSGLWMKLMPILGNRYVLETRVESDGSFQFTGFDEGPYLLVVLEGTGVLYSDRVSLSLREDQILNLTLPR